MTARKVGDVVAWADVPDGAMVRGVAGHGREAFYFRRMGDGWYVGGVAPLTHLRVFLDIPPHGNCWPTWNDWRGAPERATIVALDLTGQETAVDLQRLAEVFEVREALEAAPDVVRALHEQVEDMNTYECPLCSPDDGQAWTWAAERLHAAGWRPDQTAEDAARLLDAAAGK